MKYLLDTNACIRFLNTPDSSIARRMAGLQPEDIALCSVVKAELLFGAFRSANPTRTLERLEIFFAPFVSLPFDDLSAELYGVIRAELAGIGTPIGPNDLLIASIAAANGLTLVTHNTREFGRVRVLRIEDWET
jgi:tRNA(fMet)-specific endonuclease VapC